MDKYELAGYLANLTFVMDFHEKLGTVKNPCIVGEFHQHHTMLVEKIQKEREDEARKSTIYSAPKAWPDKINQGLTGSSLEYGQHGGESSGRKAY